MKSKKSKSRENENLQTGTSITSFNQYFEEFHKMFNHCKYNLVALNKKFDALEMFFKNYIIKDRNIGDLQNSQDYETVIPRSKKIISNKRNNSNINYDESIHDTKTEKEENFPISIEDLDYLTKNYITEETNGNTDERINTHYKSHNKNSSSRKKKHQIENVITIKKKDVQLDESLAEFFGKNNIEEEEFTELPVQLDKNTENNFVQKLFDYKTFSQSIKKTDHLLTSKDNMESNMNNNETENSKWISKNDELKSSNTDDENYKIISADLTLPLAENIDRCLSNPINKFDNKIDSDAREPKTKTKFSEFSNYYKQSKLGMKKKFVPNITTRDRDVDNSESIMMNDDDDKETYLNINESNIYFYIFRMRD